MNTPLDLSTHQRPDGGWVVTAAGEIDMSNAGVFAGCTSTRPGSPPCSRTPRGSS